MSALEPYILLAMAAVLVIALSALCLGKEIRWGQHGYWKRKEAETKTVKPTQPNKA